MKFIATVGLLFIQLIKSLFIQLLGPLFTQLVNPLFIQPIGPLFTQLARSPLIQSIGPLLTQLVRSSPMQSIETLFTQLTKWLFIRPFGPLFKQLVRSFFTPARTGTFTQCRWSVLLWEEAKFCPIPLRSRVHVDVTTWSSLLSDHSLTDSSDQIFTVFTKIIISFS